MNAGHLPKSRYGKQPQQLLPTLGSISPPLNIGTGSIPALYNFQHFIRLRFIPEFPSYNHLE